MDNDFQVHFKLDSNSKANSKTLKKQKYYDRIAARIQKKNKPKNSLQSNAQNNPIDSTSYAASSGQDQQDPAQRPKVFQKSIQKDSSTKFVPKRLRSAPQNPENLEKVENPKVETKEDQMIQEEPEIENQNQFEQQENQQYRTYEYQTPRFYPNSVYSQVVKQQDQELQNPKTDIFTQGKFTDMQLSSRVLSALQENGYEQMTSIQGLSIKRILETKNNVAIKSQTGSGKTIAYLAPIIHFLCEAEKKIAREDGSQCFIICPTRELCIQVQEIATKLVKRCIWLVVGSLIGGENPKKEKARLRKGVSILISTPSRLLYHLKNTQSLKYDELKYIVFEESDRTLDFGFKKELEQIVQIVSEQSKNFDAIRKFLVSATFNEKVEALYLKLSNDEILYLGFSDRANANEKDQDQYIRNDREIEIPTSLKQLYALVYEDQRFSFLLAFLKLNEQGKMLIFVSTCDEVEYYSYILQNIKYQSNQGELLEEPFLPHKILKLHGNIEQKDRRVTYQAFKEQKAQCILICTDVASRGLDFKDLTHTILLDVPNNEVEYCNRVGRTARIGQTGISLQILNLAEKQMIDKFASKNIFLKKISDKEILDKTAELMHETHQISDSITHYLDNLVKKCIKYDEEKQNLARKAYVSYIRAYSRLQDKQIFRVKNLNLQKLAKSFGLNEVKSGNQTTKDSYQDQLKQNNFHKYREEDKAHLHEKFETSRRKYFKIKDKSRELTRMEFM